MSKIFLAVHLWLEFRPGKHHRYKWFSLCPHNTVNFTEFLTQNIAKHEQQGVICMIPAWGGNNPLHCRPHQKCYITNTRQTVVFTPGEGLQFTGPAHICFQDCGFSNCKFLWHPPGHYTLQSKRFGNFELFFRGYSRLAGSGHNNVHPVVFLLK